MGGGKSVLTLTHGVRVDRREGAGMPIGEMLAHRHHWDLSSSW